MQAIDAMGYDAEYSDPLYKHIPFTSQGIEKQDSHLGSSMIICPVQFSN